MKNLLRSSLTTLFVLSLIYVMLGPIPWLLAIWHGDYPGPKILTNNITQKRISHTWLLVHGVNADARVWQSVLNIPTNVSMIAISVSNHELGPQYADPTHLAATEINQYLATHPDVKVIVGHSTAALWFAEAYTLHPAYWHKLQIILLAPNIGINARQLISSQPSKLTWFIKFDWLGYLLPNPYLAFLPITACQGINEQTYKLCKKMFLTGKLFRLGSIPYFKKLNIYMLDPKRQIELNDFLKNNAKNIKIYLASNDAVLSPDYVQQLAKHYSILYIFINNSTHSSIILHTNQWLTAPIRQN